MIFVIYPQKQFIYISNILAGNIKHGKCYVAFCMKIFDTLESSFNMVQYNMW